MIATRNLKKTFKSRRGTVEAVKGVDLRVEQGEIFGFLGPNGAGKTTTMRMLTTLMPPSGGEATIVGHDLLRAPDRVRESIGYVSQAGGTDDTATARENLVLHARLYGIDRATARARAATLIATLELDAIADRVTSTYSGGQRRRLDLALGLIHQPKLIFLDEPTTGLDPQSRARLWDEVRRLRDGGVTVFLTTHYLDEADALCDRLAIIDDGRIVAEGTPTALKRQIAGDVVTLGLDAANGALAHAQNLLREQPFVRDLTADKDLLRLYVEQGESALPAILRVLDGASLPLRTIALARPSLDDVFLRQTGRSLREASA
ncbi:MAG: ATP-binding cassette domain-containing protein [Chloroflexia bacterium]